MAKIIRKEKLKKFYLKIKFIGRRLKNMKGKN